ncbi:NADH-quinone oxidoreductase subunit B family protein [[Actinomadura] parvosata]|uniref:NADH-quinone oxidoreductase subunit B family protein n=1 Tax=[Actinomadura] parvosata TaxID=1955412 RepID=UPI00406C426C
MNKLAVWKLASCDGCQLALLDCEDELLSVAARVEIAYFLEASSARGKGPYDLSLVEGSITTPDDLERIGHIRRVSKHLVTIGACATAGGVQALRNLADVREFASVVYARPDYIKTLDHSTPVSAHVPVDFELRGCPIDKRQLLEVIGGVPGRAETGGARAQRLRGVQGPWQPVRAHRPRHPVPGPGHPSRLRRALPGVQSWLLRLLRPHGEPEPGRSQRSPARRRHGRRRAGARLPHLQRHLLRRQQ